MSENDLPEQSRIAVVIADDKKHAYLSLTEPQWAGMQILESYIYDMLQNAGVVHGIDRGCVSEFARNPQYVRKELVAEATMPERGQDAVISYLFPMTSEAKPKVLENGTVDFKQLDIIKNITSGDAVCSKTPPAEGTPGTDVTGGLIEAQLGRDFPLPLGQNTVISEDGLHLLAKIDGQVDLINNRVTVLNSFDIKGNVDYNTGNIDFVGNVYVGGDVCAGFFVRASGNVFVKGCVDGGVVEAKGNVTIVNGFNGQEKGKITCGGDLRCKYLQNAHVDVGGNLESTSCVNSIVQVGQSAKFIGSQAVILSSRVVAGASVEAQNIGSRSSSVSNSIEIGVNPRILERSSQITNQIGQIKKTLENVDRIITMYKQLEAQNRLPADKAAELLKLTATRESSDAEMQNLYAEKDAAEKNVKNAGRGAIKAFGVAYSGTKIIIGNEKKTLDTDYKFTQFIKTSEGIRTSPAN